MKKGEKYKKNHPSFIKYPAPLNNSEQTVKEYILNGNHHKKSNF